MIETAQKSETATQTGASLDDSRGRPRTTSRGAPHDQEWAGAEPRDGASSRPTRRKDDGRDAAASSSISTDHTGESLSVVVNDVAVDVELIDALKGMYFFG